MTGLGWEGREGRAAVQPALPLLSQGLWWVMLVCFRLWPCSWLPTSSWPSQCCPSVPSPPMEPCEGAEPTVSSAVGRRGSGPFCLMEGGAGPSVHLLGGRPVLMNIQWTGWYGEGHQCGLNTVEPPSLSPPGVSPAAILVLTVLSNSRALVTWTKPRGLGVATVGHATSGNSPMRSGRRGLEDQLHHAVCLGPASHSGSVSFPLTLTPYFHFQS